jgi:glycosyltransferase involved in cell wall biosynthesis
MKIYIENFDNQSDSGPNGFTKKLFSHLIEEEKLKLENYDKCDLSFCLIQAQLEKKKPRVLRLDGIYFNTQQDYESSNQSIRETYLNSDAVIFQTQFNKDLIQSWFGEHKNGFVIRNGTDINFINQIPKLNHPIVGNFSEIWSCSAAWRPHKRLNENIRYFLEFAPQDAALIVLGKDADKWLINHPRIFYAGHVKWDQQIALYKASSTFLHLAWLDHCPNVVVDARASGCKIVCSSAGGTKEIAGKNAVVIPEDDWNFKPVDLYNPPKINFNNKIDNTFDVNIDINNVADSYLSAMKSVL